MHHQLLCLPVLNGKVSTPGFSIFTKVYDREGGILSTGHYKRYNNPLQLDDQHTGVQIGNINTPHTPCADDVVLLSHSQKQWRITAIHTGTHKIQQRVVSWSTTRKRKMTLTSNFKESKFPVESSTVHLGIHSNASYSAVFATCHFFANCVTGICAISLWLRRQYFVDILYILRISVLYCLHFLLKYPIFFNISKLTQVLVDELSFLVIDSRFSGWH